MYRRIEWSIGGGIARCWWLAVGCALAAGCGAERLPVSGEVRYEGRPVEVGQITFEPSTRFSAEITASDILNGAFELSGPDGLPPGEYHVRITAMRRREPDAPAIGLDGPPPGLPEQYIPEKYNERTTLHVEVTPDETNHFAFDLTRDD